MKAYQELSAQELQVEQECLYQGFLEFKARGLKLNMARGKPSSEQLDLSMPILDAINSFQAMNDSEGTDTRNYGGLTGIKEARELMAQIMEVPASNTIVLGNSSLNIMYDTVARSMTNGVMGSTPWCKLDKVRFLCPAPGYDRHFAVTENFGIELITIPMTSEGPDMDLVTQYVENDDSVKGIWCVPKYSNPQGITYSEETVRRFAALEPAAADFRIYWDNAYAVHDFVEPGDVLLSLKEACDAAGNPDIWYMFASTSKITFAGSGISALASSQSNLAEITKQMAFQTIGPDKINQLRHVAFLRDIDGVRAHMKKQAALLAPRFSTVLSILDEQLGDLGVGEWTHPKGGYFISFDGLANTAKRTVALAKEAGVTLTGAGATYPYGNDPLDRNIRIAPTYPSVDELAIACQLFTICARIAATEALLAQQ
ncbi:MAG: aminotransferase class I/II-fold pyridoxal phosphate-dependent enzyme [Coriobacteriaceae bacterium]|nr:aminotransferase class I/II-fold pyridoxal phosphate-dependent enzyme [Coriobacteriaceae bacterium]